MFTKVGTYMRIYVALILGSICMAGGLRKWPPKLQHTGCDHHSSKPHGCSRRYGRAHGERHRIHADSFAPVADAGIELGPE